MGLAVVPLVMLSALLYYLIYYSVFSHMLIPEAVVATLVPAMRNVNIIIALTFPFVLYAVVRLSLIYSNRIVGPIPRLERDLDKIIAGDASIRMKVRDKDELQGFVTKVNALLEKLEKVHSA
jgi:signal transduction histidine kinase